MLVADVPKVTPEGDKMQDSPVLGDTLVLKSTGPVNPCRLSTVTVEVPFVPAFPATLIGDAEMRKSCTTRVTEAECVIPPL